MTPILAQRPRTDRSFERLYKKHVRDVYAYSLAVLRNPADAEDVTQTTFMNAYRAFERGERPEKPHNWLIAIAHNVCRQRFRTSQRRPQEVVFDAEVAEALVVDDESPSADDISRALGYLAFNQRAALVMRELEGRSYVEIGEILGLSVSAVETLLFRGRRALREQLEGSLTCREAELALSRQLDGRLPRSERGSLRAHLRECKECATSARKQRGQRSALKALGAVPLPASLSSFFGGGGAAAVGTGIAAKAAVVVAAGAIVGGTGYSERNHLPLVARHATPPRHVVPSRPTPPPSPVASAPVAPAPSRPAGPAKAHGEHRRDGAKGKPAHGERAGLPAKAGHGRAHGKAHGHGKADGHGKAHGHGKAPGHGDVPIGLVEQPAPPPAPRSHVPVGLQEHPSPPPAPRSHVPVGLQEHPAPPAAPRAHGHGGGGKKGKG